MTREILFRGKKLDNGEWVYGSLRVVDDGSCHIGTKAERTVTRHIDGKPFYAIYGEEHEVDQKTVGQLATLDEHNDIIFDGDILQDPEIPDEHWLVYFEQKELLWSVREVTTGEKMSLAKLLESDPEVIGNKWDNPELLEVLGDE